MKLYALRYLGKIVHISNSEDVIQKYNRKHCKNLAFVITLSTAL